MGPLRLLVGLVVAVAATGLIFTVRAILYNITDMICQALGYAGFTWDLVPEPIRSTCIFIDETIIPNAFLILIVAFIFTELILWWRETHEGRVIMYEP